MELFPLTTMVSKFTKRFIHQHTTPPKAKLAFDSVTAGRTSSIFSTIKLKAKGTVERFARDKKADPENRKSVVGYDLYGCFAIQDQGLAAIIDGVVA
jgi:hypothetical protein